MLYPEKATQKGKYKNPKDVSEIVKYNNRIIQNRKVQICKRCEMVKSNNRIIQKR